MEEQQIKDIFHFVDSMLQHKSEEEHRSIRLALELAESVAKVIEENKHLVPYHLNLIYDFDNDEFCQYAAIPLHHKLNTLRLWSRKNIKSKAKSSCHLANSCDKVL